MKLKYVLKGLTSANRRTHIVRCDTPMVLISQIQRSGGTLLSQLFDDHSQIFAHPHELHWGYPNKWDWPDFQDVSRLRPKVFWERLHSSFIDKSIKRGYKKGEFSNTLPFMFDRVVQWELFKEGIEAGIETQRDVFDVYMTSFFNAWVDYQNLYRSTKRYTAAFTPRVSMFPEYVARFFRDYPEGRMVSIVRDPLSWVASATKHVRGQKDMKDQGVDSLMEFWRESTEAILRNREEYGDTRIVIVRYGDLVTDTESTMRAVAAGLGIDFEPTLIEPTFNGLPINANTSHETLEGRSGVVSSTLDQYKNVLTEDEIDRVRTGFEPIFARI